MVIAAQKPAVKQSILSSPSSLEEWLEAPPEGTEWVDGRTVEKTGMTLTHSKVQGNVYYLWRRYQEDQKLGGQAYTEAPCQTKKRGRKPDVSYLTQYLLAQYGEPKFLPQSFSLIAEVVSPTDFAIDVYAKADEYLASGGKEVWLVFPENYRVIVITAESEQTFKSGEIVRSQHVLPGFSIAVDELLGS